jgi:membrane protein CcdC involved in cytochrome C biogenesis
MFSTSILPSGFAVIGSLIGLLAVVAWRVREAQGAVSVKKIVIPPLGMATGFSMFTVPAFRIPWAWLGIAFLVGAVGLAYPLLLTSRLVRQGNDIMMERSNAFFAVMLGLAAIRLMARGYLDTILSVQQTGALFYVLAFGMILRWRTRMLLEYRRLLIPERADRVE